MSRATPQLRIFAQRIIACETNGHKPAKTSVAATDFAVEAKLRPRLALLMGQGGFRALLTRSLALASSEVSCLRTVQVGADGSLAGLEELSTQFAPEELLESRVVLLAQLLGLLVVFIGPGLTTRLVAETWPKILLDDLDFVNGGKNEKTK